jgi:DHA3 family macrolide efflux protein-like MFS transporter
MDDEGPGFLSKAMAPFLVLFSGQAFSLFGSRLVQFALVWYLTEQTKSPTVLATASIAALLPQVFIGPFAGALVDRWNRKTVMMVADSLVALSVLILAFIFTTGRIEVWHIYTVMMFRAVGGAFQWPAMQASTSMMVPQKHLSRVAGLNQSLNGLVAISAPPAGALLLEFISIEYVLAIDVATAILAVGSLLFISVPQPEHKPGPATGVIGDMKEGFKWILSQKGLLIIMIMSLIINLFTTPTFTMLPLFITEVLNGGAIQLAWIQSANGVGMILGGVVLGVWGGFKSKVNTAFSGLLMASIGLLLFSQTPPNILWMGVASIFIFGFMNSITNSSFFSLLQTLIPHEMQGRVLTLILSTSVAVSPLGLALAGPIVEVTGLRFWFVISGLAFMAGSVVGFVVPQIRKLEEAWETALAEQAE